jgi:hypothetical protein
MTDDAADGEEKPSKDNALEERPTVAETSMGDAVRPRDFSGAAAAAFDEKVIVTQDGKRRKLTKREVAAISIATAAAKGDKAAIKLMLSWMREDEARKASAANAEARANYRLDADDMKTIESICARVRATPPGPQS